ncbi:hypothetical protein [Ralstonia mannitolilytica]|jgi:hypothetical protein|uniref:Transmembrane protein n=1 Tax=Ralstonia mannitolilytica TaxID=105219 RepID=A0AAJ5D488_9RALS|nr:hypothetical protein [Ralstonia mannitolilytica]CAG2152560.1 hypothetical protein LMG6866_04280 [Ralstonia mannitolilytica]CAJ0734480.1 hypothetical protein R77592_03525 [Ralstonia mannitolilytica]SUD87354.1 Uncharacterised protein [Ralstonia mannitolilytica]SUD97015.1 Uncharacterised protein [Ralstonia mannitolilytica]
MLALVNLWMLLTAFVSVALLNYSANTQRWGALVGLLGQPAWLYLTHVTGEAGMFTASVFFAVCYGRGVWCGFVMRGRRHG